MKRKILSLMLVALTSVSLLSGCGDKVSPTDFSDKDVLYKPTTGKVEVTLMDYNNIDISSIKKTEVTDKMVQEQIDAILDYYRPSTKVETGTVEKGSFVYITFDGYIDDKKDENACSTGYTLEIGSNTLIEGFETGLIGAKVGDVVTLNLKFPNDYGIENYNGKDVKFVVTIKHLVEYGEVEWNDAFVEKHLKDTTAEKYTTTAAYEKFLREDMIAYYEDAYKQEVSDYIVKQLTEKCTINGITDEEIEAYKKEGIDYYKEYASSLKVEFDVFITQYMGYKDNAAFEADILAQAKKDLTYKYAVLAIAKEQGYELTGAEYKAYLEEIAGYYGSDYETIKKQMAESEDMNDVYEAAVCSRIMAKLTSQLTSK